MSTCSVTVSCTRNFRAISEYCGSTFVSRVGLVSPLSLGAFPGATLDRPRWSASVYSRVGNPVLSGNRGIERREIG